MATFNSFILLPATCRSTTVPRERIVAFPWQHSTVLYCCQLHVDQQQYQGNVLLCFRGNSGHANTPWCYVTRALPISFPLCGNDVWWWETPRHSVHRCSHELRGEQILTLRKVKTCRLQKQSMIRHRKWSLEQLSVSGIVLWNRL